MNSEILVKVYQTRAVWGQKIEKLGADSQVSLIDVGNVTGRA